MANALTNLTDTIIVDAAFQAYTAAVAPLRAFALNCSPGIAQRGDKVKVLYVPSQDAAGEFSSSYSMQDADATGIDVTLNQHFYASWALTDREIADQPQVQVESFGRQKGFQLAKQVFQKVLSTLTFANFGSSALVKAASAPVVLDDVAALRLYASARNWPEGMRTLVWDSAYTAYLLKDAGIQSAAAFGSNEAIREGKVTRVFGFDVFDSTIVPANAGQKIGGFICTPDALLIAMRYLAPQPGHNYSEASVVTDPSGFTLGFRAWYDPDSGQARRVLEALYGFEVGNAAALGLIRTEASIYS
jgi:hypothetical protein